MAAKKKKISIQYGIGETPKCTRGEGGCFCLRSPVTLNLKPGGIARINTGVRVSAPVHVFEARRLTEQNVHLPDGIWAAADEGTLLSLSLENKGDKIVPIDVGDVIAKFVVLDCSDVEEE